MKKALHNFYNFYKNPSIENSGDKKDIIYLFGFFFIITILYTLLIIPYVNELFNIGENINSQNARTIQGIIIITILAPIIEEVVFRGSLSKKFNEKLFYFSALGGLAFFGYSFIILGTFLALIGMLGKEKYKELFKYLIYIIPLYFGIIHIFNYELTVTNILLTPILTFPQIVIGAVLCYIRFINGLTMSILFHALYNSLIILIGLITFQFI